MTGLASTGVVEWRVCGYNETNEEEIDQVEDANTGHHLFSSTRNFLCWVCGLGSSQTSKFGSAISKRGCNKDGTESMETIEESTWIMPIKSIRSVNVASYVRTFIPVFGTNVASSIGWYTTTINDNTQDHESNTTEDFHHAENKFDLT